MFFLLPWSETCLYLLQISGIRYIHACVESIVHVYSVVLLVGLKVREFSTPHIRSSGTTKALLKRAVFLASLGTNSGEFPEPSRPDILFTFMPKVSLLWEEILKHDGQSKRSRGADSNPQMY